MSDTLTPTEIEALHPLADEVTAPPIVEEETSLLDTMLEGLKKLKDKDVSKDHKEILEFINLMSEAKYSVFYDDEKHRKWTEIKDRIDGLIASVKDLKTGSAKIVGVNLAFNSIKGKSSSGYF